MLLYTHKNYFSPKNNYTFAFILILNAKEIKNQYL